MHTSSGPRTRRRALTALVASAAAIMLSVLGPSTPAFAGAAPATVPTSSTIVTSTKTTSAPANLASTDPKKATATATCAAAKKGFATCFALRRDDVAGVRSNGARPLDFTPNGFGAGDLQSAYGLPAGGGVGTTVAIIDAFDNPNAEADLAVYRAQFGLPPCTTANGCFRKVDQRGGTNYPPPDTGWAGEISLDVDMVSAAAPGAQILLVETDSNSFLNLAAGVDQAVAMGAKYISNSYGSSYNSTPGSGEDSTEVTDLDPHYNHPGVAVVASSGDNDFGVSYPAASQYVTSVGGTALVRDSSARGWSESVWHNSFGGPGSGCSIVEAKPAWQTDSGCSMRTVADVAAVADPATGVAVYQTFGFNGWAVYGGTSASAPIITATYAAAGTPVAGTYPSSYPYANPAALNDVTSGLNGSCAPAYLCTAGAGYDGPTGLGTPHGLAAFTTGPHGLITGTVTDSSNGAGIGGAAVSAGTSTALTNASGAYSLQVPVGTYDVTAAAFGFGSATTPGVVVTDGGTTVTNFSLTAAAHSNISGNVTDGSGHNWPLYARITVDGVPGGPVFTDPATGHYSLNLPQGATYQLHVTPVYSGYTSQTASVALGTTDAIANVAVPVDVVSCNAPGYATHFTGAPEPFDSTSTPAGWTVDNGTGTGGWTFTDLGNRGNLTGGSGGFAIVDSDNLGFPNSQDTTLTAPAADFSLAQGPTISFDNDYRGFPSQTGTVEVSIDNGATWIPVWSHGSDSVRGPSHFDVPVPQAAGHTGVLVRFHFTATFGWWWELDNVTIGNKSCDPIPGGLVFGNTLDANTHLGVNGTVVTSNDNAAVKATSAATPEDQNLEDGFYWLFSPQTGQHPFTATKSRYQSLTKTVNVKPDFATGLNFNLKAGQLVVTPTSIDKTVAWQASAAPTVTVKNTGSAPATLTIGEQPGGFQILTQGGAPLNRVTGTFSKLSVAAGGIGTKPAPAAAPSDAPWTAISDYPTVIQDNLAAVSGGKLYAAFGFNGTVDTSTAYVYDSGTGAWTPIASAADTREKPAGGFLNGKLYAVGGWGSTGDPDPTMEVYDPGTNTWSTAAPTPKPFAASGSAVLGGKLYVVGGCSTSACGFTDVSVYDPATNTWSAAASYPEATAWLSCGAIAGNMYCAGGTTDASSTTHTYQYDPVSNLWSPRANMPADLWGSATVAANGMLLVSGGVTGNGAAITNQGYAYNPLTDSWTGLPNANQAVYRGASACGFYQIGGSPGGIFVPPVAASEILPGFADCGEVTDVPWLSESATTVTLDPGATAKVTVTLDASASVVTQPGSYTAQLALGSDTPYQLAPIDVTMRVSPPKTWGKITGTVTSATTGLPIAGATVQIDTWAASYTLKTDKFGNYALWLDVRNNPLQLIIAKDGFQPQTTKVKIRKGETTTASFALKPAP